LQYVDRMSTHDIHAFATGLSARLATRSRHVNLFLGAGSSKSAGLPDVSELQSRVLADLADAQRTMLETILAAGNLESALTKIRRMVALLGTGDQIDGINADQARELDHEVCRLIIKHLSVTKGVDPEPLANLAAWLVRATYIPGRVGVSDVEPKYAVASKDSAALVKHFHQRGDVVRKQGFGTDLAFNAVVAQSPIGRRRDDALHGFVGECCESVQDIGVDELAGSKLRRIRDAQPSSLRLIFEQ
jgi:hypothetical protein